MSVVSQKKPRPRSLYASILLSSIAIGGAAPAPVPAFAREPMTGREIMQAVNDRDDGTQVTRTFRLELTDRNGRTRIEETIGYRRYFGEEKRTILFYTDPTNVRGTGFLTFDYPDPSLDDDQWLYLPALRKVRRISASDRGDYFLGTDFTYEEIKKEQKVELADYVFTAQGTERVGEYDTLVVEGRPASEALAEELGYSRTVWRIDPDIWMSRKTDYYDLNGNHLKTAAIEDVQVIDGIVTMTQAYVQNHKTGHATRLTFSDIDYEAEVDQHLFTQTRLRRGL